MGKICLYVVIAVVALFTVSSAFSTISFMFENTNTNTDSLGIDSIKVSADDVKNCKFNVTSVDLKENLSSIDCNSYQSISFKKYGSATLNITVFNDTKNYSKIYEVTVHPCYDLNSISVTSDNPVVTVDLSSVKCDNHVDGHVNISSNYNGIWYDSESYSWGKSITGYSLKKYYIVYNFSSETDVTITVNDSYDVKSFNVKVKPIKLSLSNVEGCPGDRVKIKGSLNFKTISSDFKLEFGQFKKSIKEDKNEFSFNYTIPQPKDGVSVNYAFYVSSRFKLLSGTYKFSTPPIIGPTKYEFIKKKDVSYNCFDSNGLPVPCNYTYLLKVTHDEVNVGNFKYYIKLNVVNGDYSNNYYLPVDNSNPIYFGFDGSTTKKCKYTISTDVSCKKDNNEYVCVSEHAHTSYVSKNKICATRDLTITGYCPGPTVLKRYHDMKRVVLPLHLTFGVKNDSETFSGYKIPGDGAPLFGYVGGSTTFNSGSGNVKFEIIRHEYTWKIKPFNFLIFNILKDIYVPMLTGFNQTQSSSGLSGSACIGNSTCYSKMPYCGDGVCDVEDGESCLNCKADCGCGINTFGCFGLPNVPEFTDSHGCILRYHKYEENCSFSEECDPNEGLKCVFDTTHGKSEIGHCCKPGEIWDPDTPKGFDDANQNIKGTCRVPRGVKITKVNIGDDSGTWYGFVCGGMAESVADKHITVDVKSYNPLGEEVCVLVATYPYECCNANYVHDGGAEIKCKKIGMSATFTFHTNIVAPQHHCIFGWNCHIVRRCDTGSKMLVLAWIPSNKYPEYNRNYFMSKVSSIIFTFNSTYTTADGGVIYNQSNDNTTLDLGACDHPGLAGDASHGTCEYSAIYNSYTNETLNGHNGNILIDGSGHPAWADILVYTSSSKGECNGDDWNAAGSDVANAKEYTPNDPNGHGSNVVPNTFICGGYDWW